MLRNPRLIILKRQHMAHLFDGDRLVRSFAVDLGVHPDGNKLRDGDGRTPEGVFRIVLRNRDSRYHRFLGISYPGPDAVEFGRRMGLISGGEAESIRMAAIASRCLGWNTALGGGIGLHGGRRGEDWTEGCVALSKADIEQVFDVLRIGDEVEILP